MTAPDGKLLGIYAPCHHKVVALTHAADSLNDLGLIVFDDFHPLQVLPKWSNGKCLFCTS